MSGYWIVRGSESRDAEAAAEYGRLWADIAQRYNAKIIAGPGTHLTVEGKDYPRNLIVEFPNYQDAVECYNDPDYTDAMVFLKKAFDRELVIVGGN
jgi:uncharacterized protein (DUF1330 family)